MGLSNAHHHAYRGSRLPRVCHRRRSAAALSGLQSARLLAREFSARRRVASGQILEAQSAPPRVRQSEARQPAARSKFDSGPAAAMLPVDAHPRGMDDHATAVRRSVRIGPPRLTEIRALRRRATTEMTNHLALMSAFREHDSASDGKFPRL